MVALVYLMILLVVGIFAAKLIQCVASSSIALSSANHEVMQTVQQSSSCLLQVAQVDPQRKVYPDLRSISYTAC